MITNWILWQALCPQKQRAAIFRKTSSDKPHATLATSFERKWHGQMFLGCLFVRAGFAFMSTFPTLGSITVTLPLVISPSKYQIAQQVRTVQVLYLKINFYQIHRKTNISQAAVWSPRCRNIKPGLLTSSAVANSFITLPFTQVKFLDGGRCK